MPGVKLHHTTLRGVTATIVDESRAYGIPFACPRCRKMHVHKTYHVPIDVNGVAVVSADVWEKIRPHLEQVGFILVGEEVAPPPQTVGTPETVAELLADDPHPTIVRKD